MRVDCGCIDHQQYILNCADEIRFINGITRMPYLAAFSDSSIPIKCDKDSAESLFNLFGDKNYEPHSLEEYRIEYENKSKFQRDFQ